MPSYKPGAQFKNGRGMIRSGAMPDGTTSRPHKGRDFPAPSGTPIPSAYHGKVIYSGSRADFGNAVVIEHTLPDGTIVNTLYAHMTGEDMPTTGDIVEQGQSVGRVGNTGRSYGDHLHFEVIPGRLDHEKSREFPISRDHDRADPDTFDFPPAPGEDQQPDEGVRSGSGGSEDKEAARMAQDAAWESTAPGRAPQRSGQRPGQRPGQADMPPLQGPERPLPDIPNSPNFKDEHPGEAFLREEQEMLRKPPGIELHGRNALDRGANTPSGPLSLAEQPLPRPINLLTDPLSPEDDPDGLEREAWEQWRRGLSGGAAVVDGSLLPASMPRLRTPTEPPRRTRPPGYVDAFPEPDEEGGAFFPERRDQNRASPGLPGASEEMSTLDFVKEAFRLAAEGVPETPRPKRPAWFRPSNPEELTTEEYIWEIFNPRAAKRNHW